METLTDWHRVQLTHGTDRGRYHAHAYYDIPVFDEAGRFVAGHQMGFAERQPEPHEAVEVGVIDLDGDRDWRPVGTSRAWSWQQGPMTQWLPGGTTLVWNDRDEEDRFVARRHDLDTGGTTTLPRPVYAVDPRGRYALSLNMARLDHLRPGYGYAGGTDARMDERRSRDDGVWRLPLDGGEPHLVLSLHDAARFLLARLDLRGRLRHMVRRYHYWFNHVKIAPDGRRFTVKLRFRQHGRGWNETQGVSLTARADGTDLRLLADATSHVIWLDTEHLFFWRRDGVYLYHDEAPVGRRLDRFAPELLTENVHIRRLPGTDSAYVFDTPYREEVDLLLWDRSSGRHARIDRFEGHRPARGLFRCDLHPVPSPDGRRLIVTSLDDGGRQMYLLER